MRSLLLGTGNRHKVEELRAMLQGLPFRLFSLNDVAITHDVEEIGDSFQDIAALKARAYAREANMLTLADDSGLEIDALGGEPGIYSARYLGPDASYEERFQSIFSRLAGLPQEQRTARFRSVVAIAEPTGEVYFAEGTVEGLILAEARGAHGFGYDPIFFVPELGLTTAEMTPEQKNQISHRGRAIEQARLLLANWPPRS